MKNLLIGAGLAAAVVFLVATYLITYDSSDGSSTDLVADEAKCAAGATDCVEPGGSDVDSACLAGSEDCNDNPGTGGLGICAPDPATGICTDTFDSGVGQICIQGAADCNDTPIGGDPDGEARATEIVFADLESRIDSTAGEITVISTENVDWPDSCLGVEQPETLCAQVITPGYKIVLEQLGAEYEYHTDATGDAYILLD